METQSSSRTAVDNSSAAESSEKHVVWTGKPCQHLEKGIDLEKLEQYISRVSLLQCQGCGEFRKGYNASASKDKKGKSKMYVKKSAAKDEWLRTWMCLACGHVGCSSISTASEVIGTGHAWKHWLDTKHPYAVQWGEDVRCWCFSCKAILEFDFFEEEENQGLVMVGPSASDLMLQALRVVQEKLVKESVKFRDIRLADAIVEKKPLPSEEDGGGSRRLVKGLMNLGNTCFFNSVMQNLLAIGVLQDHFSRPAVVTEGRLTSCLRKLYAEMTSERQAATDAGEGCSSAGFLYSGKGRTSWDKRNGIVNPGALFSAVCDQAPCFRGFHQQDSQEFLLYLLDCLNTEELNARKLQNTSFEKFAEMRDDKTKELVDSNGDQSDNFTSFFSSVFGSELSSTICCSECGHSSVSFESFLDLSLAMPSKRKPSSSNIWASSSVYAKRLTKTHDESRKGGQRTVEAGLSSLLNISEVKKEPSDEMEEASCSLYKNIAPGADARDTNKSDFPEDFGWMDFLDAPAQSADMVFQDTMNTSEIMEVLGQDQTSVDVSEITSMGQLSTSKSAFQNQGLINQNAVFSQTETSEKNLSTTEGDFGTNDDQDMMHVSDWEDNHEAGQEEELLQMVGDSEVLFLPYKDIDAADEGSEALGYFQNLSLGSTDETLDKHLGDEPLSGLNPDVIDSDFDGFAEMFNEEENSFQKLETEAGDNFQLNEGNGGDDIWDIELAVTTEEGSETNKEGPEGIALPISLDGCLTAFTRPELLSGENAWECENCYSKILNDPCKWCVGVSKRDNKQIQYKQTVISNLNDTGTYEEQLHLVNGGGSISICRGRILWVMDVCVDWTRRPNFECLILKWYSSKPKSHFHQYPQSIGSSSTVNEGTAHNSDINQSIVAEEEKMISLEEREMFSRPKMQNQYDELLLRHSTTVPSRAITGIDDRLTDYEKICGVFLQKLKGKAALEAAFAQTSVILTYQTIERIVKRASLSGQALLTFFRWAGKQPNCQHNLDSYNVMLSGLGRRKYFDHMEELLHQMNTQGPSPTFKTIDIVITRYIKANRIAEAVKTFDRMEEFGLKADTAVLNTLLHRLCQDNHARSAHCLLNKMRKKISPDNITYSIIIGGWAKQGRIKEVYRTLNDMSEQDLKPDCITYNYVLEGLFRAGKNNAAAKLLKNMSVKGCSPTTIIYNTVIKHLCLGGSLNEGLTYYDEMLAKGCKPNNTTYSLLIRFLIKARRVAESLEIFNLMLEGGFIPEAGTVNSFIEPLCKFGPPDAAIEFYKQMKLVGCNPNLKTYKLLLMRLGRFGLWDQMLKVWNEMEESGWTSDVEVYTYIVNGFCNGRKLDEAAYFMGEALSKGFCPGRIICSKLIHKLIRARKAEVAYNIFRKLKDARRNDKIKRIQRSRGWQY